MKLSRFSKQIIAVACAVAMVVVSLVFVPSKKTVADEDYSNVTFTRIGNSDYYVGSNNNEFGFQTLNDQGTRLQIVPNVASGTKQIWPPFTDETLNGTAGSFSDGAGIYINKSLLTENYNVYEATSAVDNHRFQIIIKYDPNASTAPIVDGTELIPTDRQNSGTLDVQAYSAGNPWDREYKVDNLSITNGMWYVAKYTVTSDITKKFELRLQDASDGYADYTNPAGFVITEVQAGQTVTVTKLFQANRSTANGIMDVCMGYVDNTSVGAAKVQITNFSLKIYTTEEAARDAAQEETSSQVAPSSETQSESQSESESVTATPTESTVTPSSEETPTEEPTVLPDFDNLNWISVDGMYTKLAYSIVKNEMTGFSRMNFYSVNYMQFIGSGDTKFNEATMQVLDSSANDVTSRLSWNDRAAAIWGKMVSQLGTTDEYYLFTVSNENTGTVQVAIRVGNPGGGETESQGPQKPLAPAGLTWAGNDNLPYYFAWQPSATAGVEYYNFYVGDVVIGTSVAASYNADGFFGTAAPGEYTVGVTAVKEGLESDMITYNYTKPYPVGYYDVADYKGEGEPYTYPTETGKIFAGWYTDDTCSEVYEETTGYAYAKFIDEDVLTVKFQDANDGTCTRFLSSLDSMDYEIVGFAFVGQYKDQNISEKTKTTERLMLTEQTYYLQYLVTIQVTSLLIL